MSQADIDTLKTLLGGEDKIRRIITSMKAADTDTIIQPDGSFQDKYFTTLSRLSYFSFNI